MYTNSTETPSLENLSRALSASPRPIDQLFASLIRELLPGLKHGFFEMGLTSELIPDRKRRVVLKAGKSYQFIIPEEQVY